MSKKDVSHSKFLSLVLRHQPEAIGVVLDPQGWIDVDVLLNAMAKHGHPLDFSDLERLVRESDKKRFALNEDGKRIRANQGHSVEVDLALSPQVPPEVLYHGTVDRFLDSIKATGLEKRERHHVHLSSDIETAMKVGQRRGKPVLLEIRSGDMHRAGHVFFVSDNGVWLTDRVPAEFLIFPSAITSEPPAQPTIGLTTLFRPTGMNELELIHRSGMKAFPPRLPEQPIFYPVMNRPYAQQIARDWNSTSAPNYIGFVLCFDIEANYAAKFPVQKVGGQQHLELWVPAEDLEEFNRHIVGTIRITDIYRGEACTIEIDEELRLPKAWLTQN